MPGDNEKLARWTRRATRDAREIWRYYSEVASREVANRLIAELIEAANRAAGRPLNWPARGDIAPGVRGIRRKPYIVFFRSVPDGIEILRVLHERRDIAAVFRTDQNATDA